MKTKIQKLKDEIQRHFKDNDEIIDVFISSVITHSSILLWAAHGKAKSLLAEVTAKAIGVPFSRVQGSQGLTETKYLARYNIAKLMKGEEEVKWRDFVSARIKFLDEVNRVHPTVLNGLFSMLAEKILVYGDERREVQKFVFIGTMNPADEGTYQLPTPFVDRFDVCLPLLSTTMLTKTDLMSVQGLDVKQVISEDEFNEIHDAVETVKVPRVVSVQIATYIRDLQLCVHGDKEFLTNYPQCCAECRFKENVCGKLDNKFPVSDRAFLSTLKIAKGIALIHGRKEVTNDDALIALKYALFHRARLLMTHAKGYETQLTAIEYVMQALQRREIERSDLLKAARDVNQGDRPVEDLLQFKRNDLLAEELYESLMKKDGIKRQNYVEKIDTMTLEEMERTLQQLTSGDLEVDNMEEVIDLIETKLTDATTYKNNVPEKTFKTLARNMGKISESVKEVILEKYGEEPEGSHFVNFAKGKIKFKGNVRTKTVDVEIMVENVTMLRQLQENGVMPSDKPSKKKN